MHKKFNVLDRPSIKSYYKFQLRQKKTKKVCIVKLIFYSILFLTYENIQNQNLLNYMDALCRGKNRRRKNKNSIVSSEREVLVWRVFFINWAPQAPHFLFILEKFFIMIGIQNCTSRIIIKIIEYVC